MVTKLINGVRQNLTAEEIAQRNSDIATYNAGAFDRAMADLRTKRNKDLQDSDHKVLPDSPLTSAQKSAWMAFRTKLRDVTKGLNTVEDVNNLDYPDKPTE